MPALYNDLTRLFEFAFVQDVMDVETWPQFSNLIVGFLDEFTNVTQRGPQDAWFNEYKFFIG